MKPIILFLSLLVFSLFVSCGESKQDNNESNSSIKIQDIGLEVMSKDLGRMNWEDAKKACTDLGDGWRLPTMDELKKMYELKDKIGGFEKGFYWSSMESSKSSASGLFFRNDNTPNNLKINKSHVRAVRDLK